MSLNNFSPSEIHDFLNKLAHYFKSVKSCPFCQNKTINSDKTILYNSCLNKCFTATHLSITIENPIKIEWYFSFVYGSYVVYSNFSKIDISNIKSLDLTELINYIHKINVFQ